MRERSTWNLQEIAKKAAKKQAAEVAGDVYSMNQDHPQPGMDEYVIGDSSDFAEDVHEPNTWEEEYANGQTERDEIGMPEYRKDTFNHAEKTAADKVRLKKAELCVAVAKLMLTGKKVAGVDAVEDQAYALMYMPDQELINTHKRLAAEQEQEQEEEEEEEEIDDLDDDDSDDELQEKQAGEIPPQFKENIQKMKDKAKGKSDDDADDDGEQKQAGEMPQFIKDKIEEKKDDDKKDEGEKKQAKSKSKSKTSEQVKEPKEDGGDQNAKSNNNWPTKSAGEQLAQMQQMMAQMQQMLQQAQGQQQAPAQEAPVMAHGDELDQMLVPDESGPMAEVDIEMEPSPMDVDNIVLAGDDEILRHLFAQEDEQVEEEQEQVQQGKQAAVRTASTRTVGTRPTVGVAKLGGSVSKTAASIETDRLSSLWTSAPDVRDAFGLK
jgi:hypothetical protein